MDMRSWPVRHQRALLIAELAGLAPRDVRYFSDEVLAQLRDENGEDELGRATAKATAETEGWKRTLDWSAYASILRWSITGALLISPLIVFFSAALPPVIGYAVALILVLDLCRIGIKRRQIDQNPAYITPEDTRAEFRNILFRKAWRTAPYRYLFYLLFTIPTITLFELLGKASLGTDISDTFLAEFWFALVKNLLPGATMADNVAAYIAGAVQLLVSYLIITLIWGFLRSIGQRPSVGFDLPPPPDPEL